MNKFSSIIKIIVIIFLVAGAVYAFNRLDFFKKKTTALTEQKMELINANESLEKNLDNEKKENAAKIEKVNLLLRELAGLQDIKAIKEENALSWEKLKSVNNEYVTVKKETSKLKQKNLSLSHRLNKLTNEFSKTLEEVNKLQSQVNESKSDTFVRKFVIKLKKAEDALQKREDELAELKENNRTLSLTNTGSDKKKKILQKSLMKLEKDNARLQALVDKIRVDFNEQQRQHAKLQEDIKGLTINLKESETDKIKLAQQLEKLASKKQNLEEKLDSQSERIHELEDELFAIEKKAMRIKKTEQTRDDLAAELAMSQKKLKDQEKIIARLETAQRGISINEIPLAKSGTAIEIEGDLNRAYALYDTAKAQVVKFSELLMSKEVELETSKQRIAVLEEDLNVLRMQPEAAGDKKYALLHDRIKMLNEALLVKDDVLQKKDEEVSALKQAIVTIDQRLEYQEKEYKNANILYADLKSQLLQSTELLARREREVIENNKEVLNLKSELILVQAEYKIKEHELKDLRMQQKKTLDDLSKITNLNVSLQENTQGYPTVSGFSQDEKQKADRVKRELEELLGK